MEEFQQRTIELLRRQNEALCAPCVAGLLGIPHLTARRALDGLAMVDAFEHAQQCHRCGGLDTVVRPRSAAE